MKGFVANAQSVELGQNLFQRHARGIAALVTVWAFFIAPALPFTIVWVKKFFGNMNFEQSFRLGYLFGCGWGVLALLFFLIASPVSGTLWLIQTAKAVRSSAKENRERAKNPNESDDVFDL